MAVFYNYQRDIPEYKTDYIGFAFLDKYGEAVTVPLDEVTFWDEKHQKKCTHTKILDEAALKFKRCKNKGIKFKIYKDPLGGYKNILTIKVDNSDDFKDIMFYSKGNEPSADDFKHRAPLPVFMMADASNGEIDRDTAITNYEILNLIDNKLCSPLFELVTPTFDAGCTDKERDYFGDSKKWDIKIILK